MRIGVLGSGAIGGFLTALLWRAEHSVVCIGKEAQVVRIERDGIRLESPVFGTFVARPRTTTLLSEPVDVVFVAVKSPTLIEALHRLSKRSIANATVIPLLNGLGHRETIEATLSASVAVGTIGFIEVAIVDGIARQLSSQQPHIDLGSREVPQQTLQLFADALRTTGLTVSVLGSEAAVIWKKLVRLNAIASTTAAAQAPVGFVRSDPQWRRILEGLVREAADVARKEGVDTDPGVVLAAIDRLPAELTTSLQRDIAARVPSEIESITGGVLRRAKQWDVACPCVSEVYDMLKRMAST